MDKDFRRGVAKGVDALTGDIVPDKTTFHDKVYTKEACSLHRKGRPIFSTGLRAIINVVEEFGLKTLYIGGLDNILSGENSRYRSRGITQKDNGCHNWPGENRFLRKFSICNNVEIVDLVDLALNREGIRAFQ